MLPNGEAVESLMLQIAVPNSTSKEQFTILV